MLYIPERFSKRIDAHLLGNILELEHYPLILSVIGEPGMGKTFQLRKYLELIGVNIFSVSAADLESVRAGEPAKLIQQKYIEASNSILKGFPSVLLIDDIDTTLGEWEKYTGTINHQSIMAFLMHIADNPYFIENVGMVRRVPIFFTGNHYERLYAPLIREGRATKFEWIPTTSEKIDIVSSIFSFSDKKVAEKLVAAYPEEKISFFSSMLAERQLEHVGSITDTVIFSKLITDSFYKKEILEQYKKIIKEIPWEQIALEALDSKDSTT